MQPNIYTTVTLVLSISPPAPDTLRRRAATSLRLSRPLPFRPHLPLSAVCTRHPTWPPASPCGHTPSARCILCCVPRREHRQLKSSKKRPSKQKGQDVVCGGAAQIRWSLLLLLLCRIRVLLDPSMYSVLVHWSLLLLPPSRSVCY